MFVEPLRLTTPLGALNGALMVDGELRVLEEVTIDADVTAPIIDVLRAHDLSVWLYQGADWYVLDRDGPHVQHELAACTMNRRDVPTSKGSRPGSPSWLASVMTAKRAPQRPRR